MSTLDLRELIKHYPTDGDLVRAVDGVSLSVEAGEFVALYGPSGSGKTTLLTLAAAIVPPDRGSVWFEGQDISRLPAADAARYRREDIGFIFQSFHLMSAASVVDNVGVKLVASGWSIAEARRAALPWVDRVGLTRRRRHTPGRLSSGERQRVAIARALVNTPRLLLADEPTGSLDSRRGRDILGLLRTLSREHDMAVLLATHDPQAMRFVDRVHTLRDGQLAAGAEPEPSPATAFET